MSALRRHHPKFVTSLILLLIVTLISVSPVFSNEVPPQGQQTDGTKTDGKTEGKTDGTKTDGTKTDGTKTDGTKTDGKTEGTKQGPSLPPLITILQTTVLDSEKSATSNDPCYPFKENATLRGTGVVLIDVKKDEELRKYMASAGRSVRLFINGFLMDADPPAFITCGDQIRLRYYINPGRNSQKLWISLYHSASDQYRLSQEHPLRIELGWDGLIGTSSYVETSNYNNFVAITDDDRMWAAFIFVAFISVLFIWMMLQTDILRDFPRPPFWVKAEALRKDFPKDPTEREKWLLSNFSDYDPAKASEYEKAAKDAIRGTLPLDAEIPATLIGLVLGDPVKSPPRAAYSFARVQMGLWFCFAVLSSIYLWIIYKDLVPIDNSILGLVGLSASTGVISMVVDNDIRVKSVYFPSKGLFYDLITSAGEDDKPQIYRFQALVVNLLLLFIGILHIVQQLTFPTFDPTWLAFLGISGAAYVTGKKVIEADK